MSAAQEWLSFATDDIRTAEAVVPEKIFNMVCFHSQQAVEKSPKAFLRYHETKVPYIHVLEELCTRCQKIDASFSSIRSICKALDSFYQPTLYPEAPLGSLPEGLPNQQQAENALMQAKAIFEFVRQKVTAPAAP